MWLYFFSYSLYLLYADPLEVDEGLGRENGKILFTFYKLPRCTAVTIALLIVEWWLMKSRKEIVVHAVRWPRATNAANVCGTSSKSLTNEPGTTNGCMLNETTAVLVLSNDRCLTSECEMVLLSQFPTSCRLRRTFWSSAIGVVSLSLLRAHATANSRHRILTKAMAISSLGREEGEVQSIRNEFRETFTKCSGSVTLEKLSPGLLALRLSNRDKRNALSPSMMVELLARVEEVEAACVTEKDSDGSPYGLILTGSHGTFCSGFGVS